MPPTSAVAVVAAINLDIVGEGRCIAHSLPVIRSLTVKASMT